jgi:hypothetical protein
LSHPFLYLQSSIYLQETGLTAIPKEIGLLKALTVILITNADHTKGGISSIPSEISALPLEELAVTGHPRLTQLPSEIGRISTLRYLYLENNALAELPAELGQLEGLDKLYVNGNKLTVLPTELGRVARLRSLQVGNNALTALPASFKQLTRLYRVVAAANRLTRVPMSEFTDAWPSMRYLNLEGNAIDRFPADWKVHSEVRDITRDLPPLKEGETDAAWGPGFYHNYVEYAEKQDSAPVGSMACLVLMGGNNISHYSQGPSLLQMTRGSNEGATQDRLALVSFRKECAKVRIGGGGGGQKEHQSRANNPNARSTQKPPQ